MTLFSVLASPSFRSIKLRSRKADCFACGRKDFSLNMIAETDYVQACGGPRPNWVERGLVGGITGYRATVEVRSPQERSPFIFLKNNSIQ
jgi:adenylyltransferase/sulfurtransferase